MIDKTLEAIKEAPRLTGDKYKQKGNEHITACLVATRAGKWGAYIITPSMLDDKIAPIYLSEYESVTQVKEAILKECLEWKFEAFTDYGNFWQKIRESGIEVPETDKMPHRQKAESNKG